MFFLINDHDVEIMYSNSLSNNIHEKITPFWLAENMSINPKQCRKMKLKMIDKCKKR